MSTGASPGVPGTLSSMDPRRLAIFSTVLERGSIGAAARELGWTQPAVSQHLAALEKEVGMKLLLRSSGGVTPTEAGAKLAVHADAIRHHVEAASNEVLELIALKKGRVRFASFPSAAAMLLPPALARMNQEYPGVDLSFTELEPPEAIAGVLENRCDLAMIFRYPDTPLEEEGTLEWTPILEDPVRLVLAVSHRLAKASRIHIADLANEEWIAGCSRCRANLLASSAAAGFTPVIRYSTDDSTVTQRLIHNDPGVIALMPEIALDAYANPSVVVKDVDGADGRQVGIVNRPGVMTLPAVRAFVETLMREAREYAARAGDGQRGEDV